MDYRGTKQRVKSVNLSYSHFFTLTLTLDLILTLNLFYKAAIF
jgi:hypothetical protein